MQAVQDVQIDSRVSRTQYQYTLQDADEEELGEWAPRLVAALSARPELADVASDQQSKGFGLNVEVDRDKASQLNILPQAIDDTLYDAFGQRQVSIIFTQLNQYRVVLEAEPSFQLNPAALDKIYVKSTTGQMVPLGAFATVTAGDHAAGHPARGPVPGRDALVQSGRGQFPGRGGQGHRGRGKGNQIARNHRHQFFRQRRGISLLPSTEPLLILAAVIVIYIILGVLYESYIHPITILSSLPSAGVGALAGVDALPY